MGLGNTVTTISPQNYSINAVHMQMGNQRPTKKNFVVWFCHYQTTAQHDDHLTINLIYRIHKSRAVKQKKGQTA